jgi:EsV-1-7 cysteine-rich motif
MIDIDTLLFTKMRIVEPRPVSRPVVPPGSGCEHCKVRYACFNFEGKQKGRFCGQHKLIGMINVKERRYCSFEGGCPTRASFGWPNDTKVRFCKDHVLEGMINISKMRPQRESNSVGDVARKHRPSRRRHKQQPSLKNCSLLPPPSRSSRPSQSSERSDETCLTDAIVWSHIHNLCESSLVCSELHRQSEENASSSSAFLLDDNDIEAMVPLLRSPEIDHIVDDLPTPDQIISSDDLRFYTTTAFSSHCGDVIFSISVDDLQSSLSSEIISEPLLSLHAFLSTVNLWDDEK